MEEMLVITVEPFYQGAMLRIKASCNPCGATCIGNAEAIAEWKSEHQCSAARGACADMATILNGWKQIARYMGRGVRTVQRWESLGLPVRRPAGRYRTEVTAMSDKLDQWSKTVLSRRVKTAAGQSQRNEKELQS